MINRVILVGRPTKNIELRKTQSGTSVVQFTLAVNRKVKNEGQPDADFINCVAWNKTADLISQYVHKGALIGTEGRIQTRSYDDKDGKRVYVTEIVVESVQFLESSKNTQPLQNNAYTQDSEPQSDSMSDDTLDIASDDLPF